MYDWGCSASFLSFRLILCKVHSEENKMWIDLMNNWSFIIRLLSMLNKNLKYYIKEGHGHFGRIQQPNNRE